MKGEQLQRVRRTKRNQLLLFLIILAVLTIWSAVGTDFTPGALWGGIGDGARFLFVDLMPPNVSEFPGLIQPALDTIYMSFVAMVIGSVIAGLLSIFAAATTSPHPALQIGLRAFSAMFRNIPVIIWTILLVASFGLGKLVGTLSLLIVSIGMLVRCYAESLEEIDMGQIEALRSTGASYWQIITQAVLPQFMPSLVGWSLYNLEINVRASTIVGMVGGGGLGFTIQSGMKLFQYKEVSMAVLLVLCIVLVTEFMTNRIRERII
ncbi:phosphonate ABC transporter, permease protein PhnE [Paenibacillus alkaliterrae]|uniref:phosphonate ABC transporter, permease protein PhnE n=1 Tax=Paenibacillus alkaliterrae TaxID=320909 RepID=UPI001F425B0F|nr:phosphonate ABC transporter, permease protein PhnE [Paenibacillus alkaliterrae]MCF2941427.1 phosphonate ABC transporter, permease protein PhnE [Paenibacillus alkaliterrae]